MLLPRRGERLPPRGPCDAPARRSSPRPREPRPRRRAGSAARIVASLMPGSSTDCAQPVSSATRPFCRVPAGDGCPAKPLARPAGTDAGRQLQHRAERLQRRQRFEQTGERLAEPRQLERGAKAPGIGQHQGQHGARSAGRAAAAVGFLDMGAGMVDQMHVVDARRAGCHAGEAGQAAVDMGAISLSAGLSFSSMSLIR